MTIPARALAAAPRRANPFWPALLWALFATLFALQAVAQAPAAAGGAAPPPPADELEKLVAPIALYPDDLVGIILPASTNPLQIVQADRFLETRKKDPKAPVDEKWDDAVKSLLNYPEVVKKMSTDLDWTAALGEAVATDSGEVMAAVQAFRRKVNSAGNLKTDDKQKVVVEQEIIKIEQANPEVIYVPQYNPTTVVYAGYSWGYYPSPYPVYYYPYPPGSAFVAGVVWGAAIGAIWNGGRYGCGWGGNEINIDRNTNINIDRGDRTNVNRPSQQGGGSQKWQSNKKPGQVSSSVGKTPSASTRVGDSRGGAGAAAGARPSTQPAGGAGRGGASGPSASTRDVGGGAGASTRDMGGGGRTPSASPTASSRGGGSAFDGGGSSARSTQMNSSRGASSRSSMSGGGARGGGGRGGGRR
jgi:hypothetical protein